MLDLTSSRASSQDGRATPHSNTGVTGSPRGENYAFSLDWLRYSVPYSVTPENCVPKGAVFEPSGEVLSPLRMYDTAVSLVCGRVDWNSERPEQKRLVNFNGSALAGLVASGEKIGDLLAFVDGLEGAKVTRLDFAIDVRGMGANPLDLKVAFEAGRGTTVAQSGQIVENRARDGKQEGVTYYVGARASERFLRVYDKAAQVGEGEDWVRIELELKGGQARAALSAMVRFGVIAAGKLLIRQFYSGTGVEWYDNAIAGEGGVYVEPVGRVRTSRERWIIEQVIPALEKELRRGNERVRFALQKLLDDTEQCSLHGPGHWRGMPSGVGLAETRRRIGDKVS